MLALLNNVPQSSPTKFSLPPPPHSSPKINPPLSHCSYTIFILPSYSLHTQVMQILTLINVQHLQNVVFSFEKRFEWSNYSSSGSHHPIKNLPPAKFCIPPYRGWGGDCQPPPLNAIWQTLGLNNNWAWNISHVPYHGSVWLFENALWVFLTKVTAKLILTVAPHGWETKKNHSTSSKTALTLAFTF